MRQTILFLLLLSLVTASFAQSLGSVSSKQLTVSFRPQLQGLQQGGDLVKWTKTVAQDAPADLTIRWGKPMSAPGFRWELRRVGGGLLRKGEVKISNWSGTTSDWYETSLPIKDVFPRASDSALTYKLTTIPSGQPDGTQLKDSISIVYQNAATSSFDSVALANDPIGCFSIDIAQMKALDRSDEKGWNTRDEVIVHGFLRGPTQFSHMRDRPAEDIVKDLKADRRPEGITHWERDLWPSVYSGYFEFGTSTGLASWTDRHGTFVGPPYIWGGCLEPHDSVTGVFLVLEQDSSTSRQNESKIGKKNDSASAGSSGASPVPGAPEVEPAESKADFMRLNKIIQANLESQVKSNNNLPDNLRSNYDDMATVLKVHDAFPKRSQNTILGAFTVHLDYVTFPPMLRVAALNDSGFRIKNSDQTVAATSLPDHVLGARTTQFDYALIQGLSKSTRIKLQGHDATYELILSVSKRNGRPDLRKDAVYTTKEKCGKENLWIDGVDGRVLVKKGERKEIPIKLDAGGYITWDCHSGDGRTGDRTRPAASEIGKDWIYNPKGDLVIVTRAPLGRKVRMDFFDVFSSAQ